MPRRLGFVANFLSDPVRSGFNSASAIIIGASQLRHLFGVSTPTETFLWVTIYDLIEGIQKQYHCRINSFFKYRVTTNKWVGHADWDCGDHYAIGN